MKTKLKITSEKPIQASTRELVSAVFFPLNLVLQKDWIPFAVTFQNRFKTRGVIINTSGLMHKD